MKRDEIIEIKKPSKTLRWVRKYVLNKYTITILAFLVWMTFFDNTSFLVINDLNKDIRRYEHQVEYYKTEFQKNDGFYKKLMSDKSEREKYARENYFMKKDNEEIFILVEDSIQAQE